MPQSPSQVGQHVCESSNLDPTHITITSLLLSQILPTIRSPSTVSHLALLYPTLHCISSCTFSYLALCLTLYCISPVTVHILTFYPVQPNHQHMNAGSPNVPTSQVEVTSMRSTPLNNQMKPGHNVNRSTSNKRKSDMGSSVFYGSTNPISPRGHTSNLPDNSAVSGSASLGHMNGAAPTSKVHSEVNAHLAPGAGRPVKSPRVDTYDYDAHVRQAIARGNDEPKNAAPTPNRNNRSSFGNASTSIANNMGSAIRNYRTTVRQVYPAAIGRPTVNPQHNHMSSNIRQLYPPVTGRTVVNSHHNSMARNPVDNRPRQLGEPQNRFHHRADAPGTMSAPHPSLPPIDARSVARNLAVDNPYTQGYVHLNHLAGPNGYSSNMQSEVASPNLPTVNLPSIDRYGQLDVSSTVSSSVHGASSLSALAPIFTPNVTQQQNVVSLPASDYNALEMSFVNFGPYATAELHPAPHPIETAPQRVVPQVVPAHPHRVLPPLRSGYPHVGPGLYASRPPSSDNIGQVLSPASSQWGPSARVTRYQPLPAVGPPGLPPPGLAQGDQSDAALARRYSELSINPRGPSNSLVASSSESQIYGTDRNGNVALPRVGDAAFAIPLYTFPVRSQPTPAPDLDNALQITINGRAPHRQPVSNIERANPFDPSSLYTVNPPHRHSTHGELIFPYAPDEPYQPWTSANQNEAALQAIRAEHELHLQLAKNAARISRSAGEVFKVIRRDTNRSNPEAAVENVDREGTENSDETIPPVTVTPTLPTSPAVPNAPAQRSRSALRTQQPPRSTKVKDPKEKDPKDPTVRTKMLKHLATATLDPAFSRKYRVKEMLGAGGYGFVCVAEKRAAGWNTGREVAVKFILKQSAISEREVPMFNGVPMEAFLLRHIDHAGIIDCTEYYEDDSMYYLVSHISILYMSCLQQGIISDTVLDPRATWSYLAANNPRSTRGFLAGQAFGTSGQTRLSTKDGCGCPGFEPIRSTGHGATSESRSLRGHRAHRVHPPSSQERFPPNQ